MLWVNFGDGDWATSRYPVTGETREIRFHHHIFVTGTGMTIGRPLVLISKLLLIE
jgi:hypothetical protein